MIPRHLEPVLRKAARQYPVVSLTGPRQSGKTTLVRDAFPRHPYASLEVPDQREFAQEDPKGFLGQFTGKVILDEVQRAPHLFSYIQGIVDERQQAGQFILTGSQNFLLAQHISQTLAGRCAMLHLLPLSRPELARQPMMDVAALGKSVPRANGKPPARSLFETLFAGGYPRIFDKHLDPQDWLRNYYQAYVEKDVRDILNVGDLETFGRFLRLCAGRSGQLLSLSALAGDAGISHTTARRWLSALEASFLVFLLRPHHKNFSKRLVKSPKLYFLDSGLLCYLLRIRSPDDLRIHAARGAVFESWVVSEIVKNYVHRGREPDVYFWRDSSAHEVDLVIERGKDLAPVEAKSGETFASDFLDGIRYWRELSGKKDQPAALVYGGEASYLREGVVVMSWKTWG
ncbi:MAG: ATP-binding protein [Planctomycetota bacterium]|nr:ATP-binding protein [Planctomycetota bacterium]